MVELKDFVRDSIIQILEGVKESHEKATELGAPVGGGHNWSDIEFDVSVAASEQSALEGKGSILLAVVGISTGAKSEEQTQNLNRIKFSVPVVFPKSSATYREKQG